MKRHFLRYIGWVNFVLAVVNTASATFHYIAGDFDLVNGCLQLAVVSFNWYVWSELA